MIHARGPSIALSNSREPGARRYCACKAAWPALSERQATHLPIFIRARNEPALLKRDKSWVSANGRGAALRVRFSPTRDLGQKLRLSSAYIRKRISGQEMAKRCSGARTRLRGAQETNGNKYRAQPLGSPPWKDERSGLRLSASSWRKGERGMPLHDQSIHSINFIN